jgi:hypothetical protein
MVESSRTAMRGSTAFIPGGERLPEGDLRLPRGRHEAELRLRVGRLLPDSAHAEDLPTGLRRYLASGLGFRPEHGGLSNNAYSVNCHVSQVFATDVACAVRPPAVGPDPVELARSTVQLALHNGPGYGDNRELYQDSDPSLLISLAEIHRHRPDRYWLRRVWPHVVPLLERVTAALDERGLLLCRRLTGNAGSRAWSSNAWDVISFGHYDAYSNAQAYRALRGMTAVAREAGEATWSERCRRAADALLAAYQPCFYNPETGLIAGWRSADDQLHDYAFPWINGLAVCYGLVSAEVGRDIMERLEALRMAKGLLSFDLGMAANLLPVPHGEHAMQGLRADGRDAYGLYINGCLTPCLATWYFRALSVVGLTEAADQVCRDLCAGFAADAFMGGVGSGDEFRTWEGLGTGYEGALVGVPHALLAVLRHLEPATVPDPEWWPA